MKIPLNTGGGGQSKKAAMLRVLDRDIMAAKKGDWEAKKGLVREFNPLIKSLAEKRSQEPSQINILIEAGQEGVYKAAKKYKKSIGADRFQIFALDFIENAMDNVGKSGGFFSRLFG